MSDYRFTAAPIIKEFLNYHESVRGHSVNTVDAYYSDLKQFIHWIHLNDKKSDDEFIDLETLGSIKRSDIYDYMTWLNRDQHLDASSRARRLSVLKSLYHYLTVSTEQLSENPTTGVLPPRIKKSLPVYLSETQANQLLDAPQGTYELRDRTILMLFLTCGLRISELASLDLDRIYKDSIKVLGKGNKERIIYLSKNSQKEMEKYLAVRAGLSALAGHEKAAFLSQRRTRLSIRRIRSMVDEKLKAAGLDSNSYSPHKLRHTAATLMLQNGVDVRVLQEVLGHERLDTTQIYTHVDDTDLRLAAEASPIGKNKSGNFREDM